MPPEALKLLVDVRQAATDIEAFVSGLDYAGYRADAKSRAAVERKFEIIGEACTRIRDRFPELFEQIPAGSGIIGFRNRLIHGYDNVDDAIVWDVVVGKIPLLKREVDRLIDTDS